MSPEGVRAYALMIEAKISLDRFAALSGVKVSTARTGLSSGRLSKAMRTVLHEIANDLQVELLVDAAKDEEVLEEADDGHYQDGTGAYIFEESTVAEEPGLERYGVNPMVDPSVTTQVFEPLEEIAAPADGAAQHKYATY